MARSSGNYGYSSLNQNQNSNLFSANGGNASSQNSIFSVRVISIVLDENHPRFKELGGWNALGAIEYDIASNPNYSSYVYPVAYPLFPNLKNFPLINEVVLALPAFSSAVELYEDNINILGGESKTYYVNSISVWNHPHHNGYSFKISQAPPSQNKSYNQVEAGSTSNVSNTSSIIFLGKTFNERANIHPILPFEGDIIYEGRWGNSIRLGSTVKNRPNNWSSTGSNGDPITIIRNGQGNQTNDGSIPIIENINNDDTSIYLTSTQSVPIEVSSTSYVSYISGSTPISPSKYAGSQIILSSGRLVFNTYEDHLLLTSAKSINLNSLESVNIDTPTVAIQANKIYLGKNEAEEPLMLGTQTINLLKTLVESLTTFMTITSTATTNICVQGTPATLPTVNSAAQNVLDDLFNLTKALGSDPSLKDCKLISKRNYTV
jgi:hypothetical protein